MTTDSKRPMQHTAPSHIQFMPKKEGYVAASDIPQGGVLIRVEGVHNNLKGIPNRVAIRSEYFGTDLLILSKGDAVQIGREAGTYESTDWIGEWLSVNVVARKMNGRPVYGMSVKLHHGHVAGQDGLIRGPRIAQRPANNTDRE